MKVAFFSAKSYEIKYFSSLNTPFQHQINYFDSPLNMQTVMLAKDHQAICAFVNDTLDKSVIEQLAKLEIKIIALRCAGYNNVDLSACKANNIQVCYVPEYSPHSVAEHTFALLLTLNRKTHKAYQRVRDNNFSLNHLMGSELHGKTIGLIGLGRIGLCIAQIASGFGLKVLATDPHIQAPKDNDIHMVELPELLSQSDIISLHCPLNESTKHIINQKALDLMKDESILLNTGRGALIDHKALIKALKSHKVGSVGLDVYEQEQGIFFYDHTDDIIDDDILMRLMSFPNVLITSHQGFFTHEALTSIAMTTLQNLKDFTQGTLPTSKTCLIND